VLVLSACGSDAEEASKPQLDLEKNKVYTEKIELNKEEVDETTELIEEEEKDIEDTDDSVDVNDLDEVQTRELLEYAALGDDDNLTDLVIENGEIKAIVEIGDNEIIDDKSLLAETVYSRAGDELLQRGGWDILTIEFVDIGNVSMKRDEKESNEYGDYFPLEKIIGQLE